MWDLAEAVVNTEMARVDKLLFRKEGFGVSKMLLHTFPCHYQDGGTKMSTALASIHLSCVHTVITVQQKHDPNSVMRREQSAPATLSSYYCLGGIHH
ncbi:hypothetical protein Y032_0131g1589 [Ancylostoma ceylanicum]|uniref:Uncharacterized protein n=1 Tax=Ancylostoma ceylanicum TaxID=53326 RepID=A0A016T5V6_9BILA|nr:hypothetical protein Y032_0131g1589 [Ancylostoma ceylanicum]